MRRENQTRDGQVSAEQDTDPRLAAQGLVKLIPPPCDSHGGGINLTSPFGSSETPRPPVDSSTRQEPEVLSTVESSTAGLDRSLGRDLSLSSII